MFRPTFLIMKSSTIIYSTIASSALLLLSSCALDPGYREYQTKQKAAQAAQKAASTVTNPVNNTANPYGVPGATSNASAYTPTTGAPYQPIPNITPTSSSNYLPSPSPAAPITIPSTTTPAIPSGTGSTTSYQVVPGDSLWKISRQFNTTVEELQALNGLTTTGIRSGQDLLIPAR